MLLAGSNFRATKWKIPKILFRGKKEEEEIEEGELAPSQITNYEVQICENYLSN
jgi:hypothetical protein